MTVKRNRGKDGIPNNVKRLRDEIERLRALIEVDRRTIVELKAEARWYEALTDKLLRALHSHVGDSR